MHKNSSDHFQIRPLLSFLVLVHLTSVSVWLTNVMTHTHTHTRITVLPPLATWPRFHSNRSLYWLTRAEGRRLSAGRLTTTRLCLTPGSWHVSRWGTRSSAASCGTRHEQAWFWQLTHQPVTLDGSWITLRDRERSVCSLFCCYTDGIQSRCRRRRGFGWECAADRDRAGFLRSVMETDADLNVNKSLRYFCDVNCGMRAGRDYLSVFSVKHENVLSLSI